MHYHTRPLRLMEAHVLLRDGPPISSKRIRFYETNGTSHRSARPPTRRNRHLMEARPLLRDDDALRTDIKGGQQMHPSGVQFGLSRGLLQLRGGEVLLSDRLLETISAEAHRHLQLGNPPIRGNFLVDITVRAAQDALGTQHQGRREAIVPFFAHLNRDDVLHALPRRRTGRARA
jgi:hypothetical protein